MNDTTSPPPSPIRREDYEVIEAAVKETARGRWFLEEYARRHRVADTTILLDAIGRLEKLMRRDRSIPDFNRIRIDLADMAAAIERTKREIAHLGQNGENGGRIAEATEELDAIVRQTEKATSEILESAERIQELAWGLRESGADDATCDRLDMSATEIYMACSFQDLTGQRTQKVVQVLQYLENRIASMIDIWGIEDVDPPAAGTAADDPRPDAHLLNGPQPEEEANQQKDIDALMDADDLDPVEIVDFEAGIDSGIAPPPDAGTAPMPVHVETIDADPIGAEPPEGDAPEIESPGPDPAGSSPFPSEEGRKLLENLVEAIPDNETEGVGDEDHESALDEAWETTATDAASAMSDAPPAAGSMDAETRIEATTDPEPPATLTAPHDEDATTKDPTVHLTDAERTALFS